MATRLKHSPGLQRQLHEIAERRGVEELGRKWLPKLLGCPFCAQKPTIEPWHGGPSTKVMIACSGAFANSLLGGDEEVTCHVAPMVTGETPKEAAAYWNTRVQKAAPRIGESGS